MPAAMAAGTSPAAPTGAATTAKFCFVALIAIDPDGVVYAAQQTRAKWIARIDPSGAVTMLQGSVLLPRFAGAPRARHQPKQRSSAES
jgi:hypothetical protein